MSIALSLHDAATNCARDGAICTLTLRSGAQFTGHLEKMPEGIIFAKAETVHMKIDGQGWATIKIDEIVAVSVRRPSAF